MLPSIRAAGSLQRQPLWEDLVPGQPATRQVAVSASERIRTRVSRAHPVDQSFEVSNVVVDLAVGSERFAVNAEKGRLAAGRPAGAAAKRAITRSDLTVVGSNRNP
jgi:hypothetical protein